MNQTTRVTLGKHLRFLVFSPYAEPIHVQRASICVVSKTHQPIERRTVS